jgi:DNA-binding transcriptional LysR family regulator
MVEKQVENLADYLVRFRQIADCIHVKGMSKRDSAIALGKSTTWISDCITKLESHWNCTLLTTKHGSKDSTKLTAEGHKLFERIEELFSSDSLLRPVNIHFSHSLLTSQLLAPALSDFIHEASDDVRQRLVSRTEMDFDVVIRDIRSGLVDLAVTWGLPDRIHNIPPGVDLEMVGPEVDMVVVAHNAEVLNSIFETSQPQAKWLRRIRMVVLSKNRQPFPAQEHLSWLRQVNCLEVETFDAALAFVRSRVGDFAIIPATYEELDRLRACGHIHYRPLPNTYVRVAFFFGLGGRQSLPPNARRLIRKIEDHLHRLRDSTTIQRSGDAFDAEFGRQAFPKEYEWFEAMRYGYYLDTDRRVGGPICWRWEKVSLERSLPPKGISTLVRRFSGNILNAYDDEFEVQQAELVGELFVVVGKSCRKQTNSVQSFVSVFSWCFQRPGIMYGLWSGLDLKKQPAVYGTIWSHCKLTQDQVMAYSNHASVSLVMNSQFGDHFADQPDSEPEGPKRKKKSSVRTIS